MNETVAQLDDSARQQAGLSRAANRQAIDTQRGLTNANRHTLSLFAAGANTSVELHVIGNHADFFQALGAAADDGGAFDGVQNLAVFNPERFTGRKHKLA